VDVSYQRSAGDSPSVNAHVEGILPQVRKVGNLIAPMLIGEQGEVALIGFPIRAFACSRTGPQTRTRSLTPIKRSPRQHSITYRTRWQRPSRMLHRRPSKTAAGLSCISVKLGTSRARCAHGRH